MTTILTGEQTHRSASARAERDSLWLKCDEAAAATGWALKPEGFCKGEVCVPVPPARTAEFVRADSKGGDEVNVAALWRHLGAPVVHDDAGSAWVLGTSAEDRASRLKSLEAPDFTLPDLAGRQHALSSYRGKKVLVVSWASW